MKALRALRRECYRRAMGIIHRRHGEAFRWEGVAVEGYTPASANAVTKQVLIGAADGAANFALRYFEVAPGGSSALDRHAHDHGVLILRGRGTVRLGDEQHAIAIGDVVYVAPDETHRFENPGPEPLGFLCVVGGRG
jgi:quercetin dioxygenase-like cupin family protein